ncbi:hypothetical protein CDAR_96961 [Caerostris darwini]|uniref:Uncharacterized protein n=1 Tax=Caerostris darwini TaxID=1538125 RepID=A0AAV4T8L3_9ARAC|nr:hypothetical protein CDAR_96961 [Caerostris darwini]
MKYDIWENDVFSLEEHGGKILVLEHRCPCCKISSSSRDLRTTSKRISGRKRWMVKKSNHMLGRGTSKCLICKRKRKKKRKKLEENRVRNVKRMEKKAFGIPSLLGFFPAWIVCKRKKPPP